ncbi:branched-chain amino acid ABC transporter permease [Ammoniphilus sp. CFH 90114]|uniref:branched-chain amino acid ABC transporter permease n=1 Tax=Ammoniphilus sp. CFH 90114 TaxID=2493665 RepID=UPI00100F7704|nr:branched-chain amino acid ABC transporter permease [Ammoniphilus sp. CFH 90114]RXT02379.1 branched-chain amino acid ABC transporter permease [Ammoniphilus sp. CFH 90114]
MSNKWLIGCLALSACFPFLFPNDYLIHIMVMAGINIILVLSLNIITGFTGQVSLGHAAFFGIGAYFSAIMAQQGLPVWVAMILAVLVAALFGFLIGFPVLRLQGHFFAIASLGFCEIVHIVFNNWIDVTRGPMGLTGIPRPEAFFAFDFTSKTHYYYLILLMICLVTYLSHRIKFSKMGRALLAIKTDEITAKAMGVHVTYYKVSAFVWSAAVAGLAGTFYAHFILFLSPETFQTSMSVNILLMLLIGGVGSIYGSIMGAMFVTLLSEYLREFMQYQMLVYGILIVIIVIFAPKGISGLSSMLHRWLPQTWAKENKKVTLNREREV